MLELLPNPSPTRRLRDALEPSGSLVTSFVPPGFAFYARILNPVVLASSGERIPWTRAAASMGAPVHPWMQWDETVIAGASQLPNDWLEPAMGDPDPSVAGALVDVLSLHTSTPGNCYFAHWDGYGGPHGFADQIVTLPPGRDMLTYSGTLEDGAHALGEASAGGAGSGRRAARWWPEDLAWCVGQDIYARSLLVGCSAPALKDLFAHPDLDVLSVRENDTVLPEDF